MSTQTITQPNQAFTPRQILEQFARGEIIPSEYSPSDTIDDTSCTEDQLVNDVIEFEDAIEAENHLIENQYALESTKNKRKSPAHQSDTNESARQTTTAGEESSSPQTA